MWSTSTLVKTPHCWKSHITAQMPGMEFTENVARYTCTFKIKTQVKCLAWSLLRMWQDIHVHLKLNHKL